MGSVAVGRFLKSPILNNFSENRARHRKPPGRKTRGIDVGGYMRKEAWSRETSKGRPISAVGVRRAVVAVAFGPSGPVPTSHPRRARPNPAAARKRRQRGAGTADRSSSHFPCGPP